MNAKDDKTPVLARVGARVRALRLEAGLTVNEFARRAGLSARFVNQLESGQGNISIARLVDVATALGRAVPEMIPPAHDDRSLRAQVWRWLSECGDDELQVLEQWWEQRQGRTSTPRFIALIGMRGAGKSTVGPLLAKRLKTEFIELDRWVEEAAGMFLGDLFATHGEAYYQRLEREALVRLLTQSNGCVFAAGGSVVTDAESWEMIKRRCFTIWLRATPEAHMKRVRRQGDMRPMQGRPAPMAELKALLKRREPLYAECQLIVKTTGKSSAVVLEEIIKGVTGSASR
jgi:XRE family aerobic/anaerobic benzoate catabolism transcriptional regulator